MITLRIGDNLLGMKNVWHGLHPVKQKRNSKHLCLTQNQLVQLPLLPGCISDAWLFSTSSTFNCSWFGQRPV
jgi:hypothetical protein